MSPTLIDQILSLVLSSVVTVSIYVFHIFLSKRNGEDRSVIRFLSVSMLIMWGFLILVSLYNIFNTLFFNIK